MHLGLTALGAFFEQHRNEPALVLATITETGGSTYRKPGAMMLISATGKFAGMISGGCLENDLLEHAAAVFETGLPAHVTYDMYSDEQLVWSLGLGCDGVIHLLLQRLDRDADFGFLPLLFDAQSRRQPAVLALVNRSESESLPPGSYALVNSIGDAHGSDALISVADPREFPHSSRYKNKSLVISGGRVETLLVDIQPVPRVLICGAGPDSVSIARLVCGLGWDCLVVDHRSHYAHADRFPAASSVIHSPVNDIATAVSLAEIDAAVIMSHHLENDFIYLEACLAVPGIAYIGILGPVSRREKLLARTDHEDSVVFGPVGLDIGAELPEAIALSTVAEIHAVLNERQGGSLTKC